MNTKIKRYEYEKNTCHNECWEEWAERPNGTWVKYSDVEELIEFVKELKKVFKYKPTKSDGYPHD